MVGRVGTFPRRRDALIALGQCPTIKKIVDQHIDLLSRWLVFTVYKLDNHDLTLERFNAFIKAPKTNLRSLLPSKYSFMYHVLRSAYQAGWVWGNTLIQMRTPATGDWGWAYQWSAHNCMGMCSGCSPGIFSPESCNHFLFMPHI